MSCAAEAATWRRNTSCMPAVSKRKGEQIAASEKWCSMLAAPSMSVNCTAFSRSTSTSHHSVRVTHSAGCTACFNRARVQSNELVAVKEGRAIDCTDGFASCGGAARNISSAMRYLRKSWHPSSESNILCSDDRSGHCVLSHLRQTFTCGACIRTLTNFCSVFMSGLRRSVHVMTTGACPFASVFASTSATLRRASGVKLSKSSRKIAVRSTPGTVCTRRTSMILRTSASVSSRSTPLSSNS